MNSLFLASVLNHNQDPLAGALAKSTVASLSVVADPESDYLEAIESTNPTSPSSPTKTPGQTLLDFKYSLPGRAKDSTGQTKRPSYQRPAPGDELRCGMIVYERPVPEKVSTPVVQNQKGRSQQPVEKEKDAEVPLMRGNTVAGYWELNRQVRSPVDIYANLSQLAILVICSSFEQCRQILRTCLSDRNLERRMLYHPLLLQPMWMPSRQLYPMLIRKRRSLLIPC